MPHQPEPGRYLGETRGHQVVAGLILTETLHRFPSQLPLHTHTAPYFCLVLNGAFDERVGATLCEARPGDLLFHPPGETHTDEIRRRERWCSTSCSADPGLDCSGNSSPAGGQGQ